MINLLMIYVLAKRERTIYGIRKEITTLFGMFTEPSIGSIYPALKKLTDSGAVNCNERISEGGKKSSYYSVTAKGKELFKKLFFEPASDNPSLFFTHLQARIGTMGFLPPEDRKNFITDSKKRIDMFLFGLETKLKDEFFEPDYYQRKLLERTVEQLKSLQKFVDNLDCETDT